MYHDKYFPGPPHLDNCPLNPPPPPPCPPHHHHHHDITPPPVKPPYDGYCTTCPPPPEDHPMRDPTIGRSPFEHSGHCHPGPDGPYPNPYQPGVPNPVPVHHHHHPPLPPRPLNELFVLKKQLNEILRNIAKADIYEDKSETGTTASVGGITAGSKLGKITFAEFVEKCLFPTEAGGSYVTQDELETILAEVAFSGDYADLTGTPESFDYNYPYLNEEGQTVLLSKVVNEVGGFKAGDDLRGMSMGKIIEKILCVGSENDYETHFTPYKWISEPFVVKSGTLEIDANSVVSSDLDHTIMTDYTSADPEEFFTTNMVDGRYKLYALRPEGSVVTENKYDCLIALSNTSTGENPQTTNSTWADVPTTLSWTLNVTDTAIGATKPGKIVLSGSGITTNMVLVLVCSK